MSSGFQISKLDAARRQLDLSIKLYFLDLDSVSVHTLSCASHEILVQIGRSKKVTSIVRDRFKEFVREDKWKEYCKDMDKARNFFKHAGKDSAEALEFNPKQTEIWIWDACLMYQQFSGDMTDYMQCFHTWYMLHHREIIKNDVIRLGLEDAKSLLERPKQEFLETGLTALLRRIK